MSSSAAGFEKLRQADSRKNKQALDTDDEKADQLSCSDTEGDGDRVTEVSLRSVGRGKAYAGNALGEATLDTKTTTFEASGSQSARKEHSHSGANIF